MYSKFQKLKPEKQKRIINAALEEFSQKGFELANTNEIVKKAEIGKGMLFHYFRGKAELFLYLVDYCFDIMKSKLIDQIDMSQRDIFVRYQQLATLKANLMVENPLAFSFAAIAITTDIQDINEQLDRRKKDFIDHGRKIFQELDLSKFRKEVDVKRAIKIISWTVEGFERELLPNAKELLETKDNFKEFFDDLDTYLENLKHCFYK